MELPRVVPVEYRGELVALASAQRVHIVAPRVLDRPAGDPELRLVTLMSLFCSIGLDAGHVVDGPTAEAWARRALIQLDDCSKRSGGTKCDAADAVGVSPELVLNALFGDAHGGRR